MAGAASLGILRRRLDPAVAAVLDDLAPENLPDLRTEGPVGQICEELRLGLEETGFGPDWLAAWFLEDVRTLAGLYRRVSGADEIVLRVEAIGTDACRRFHADNVRLRLVTTYRGPGTQWLSPRRFPRLPEDGRVPAAAIRQFGRGTVAVLRGSRNATPGRPGLLHRSPPISGTGVTRLFLAIDEAMAD